MAQMFISTEDFFFPSVTLQIKKSVAGDEENICHHEKICNEFGDYQTWSGVLDFNKFGKIWDSCNSWINLF